MAVSFHKFVDRLDRSGLLQAKDLKPLLAVVPEAERPRDSESLARWLVQGGRLTPFQAKAIFLGHTKGLIVGNYVILDLLGVGGMGQVYKAQHRRMKRIVAIKLLSPEVAQNETLVSRFHREVEAAAKLMHPNIVTAFDADEAGGKHFLVMEYVRGRNLATLVKEHGRLSVDRSIRCVLDAARGLEYAHRHGIVHRDVKPSNLLLAEGDADAARGDPTSRRVKILDLGLARIDQSTEQANTPSELTRPGIVMGTVDYMAPEQAVNTHDADHRSDIYSLGITLHFLITGAIPYPGRTVIEQVVAHREAPIPSLKTARSSVPSALDAIFRRMVAKRPVDRYQSMSKVVAALEGVLSVDESDVDLPAVTSANLDDSALVEFLDSMSGDKTAKQRAAAAVMTPESLNEPGQETMITSDRSTAVGPLARLHERRRRAIPWGPILLHATWSVGLLVLALWMLWNSRAEDAGDFPLDKPQQESASPDSDEPPAAADDDLDVTLGLRRSRNQGWRGLPDRAGPERHFRGQAALRPRHSVVTRQLETL